MKKFLILALMGLSTQAFGSIHPYFLENSNLTKDQQDELIRQVEEKCPEASDYQWTLAETKTVIANEKQEAKLKFRTSFLIISAWIREMTVNSELVVSEKLKVLDIKGCSSL